MGVINIFLNITILLVPIGCGRNPSKLVFKKNENRIGRNMLMRGEAPLGFASLQKYILKPKCNSCHSGPEAKPANDPIDFDTYETTVVDRFIPLFIQGKPKRSRFYKSVIKEDPEKRMPLESSKLSDIEIKFIFDWIKACAPNDPVNDIPIKCPDDDDDDDDDFEDDN